MATTPPSSATRVVSKPVLFGLGLVGLFAIGIALLLTLDDPDVVSDDELAALIETQQSTEALPQYYYETRVTQYASVDVETTPAGAYVTLNEEITGLSPLRLERLRPGYYAVRVDHAGHLPVDTTVYIASGTSRALTLELTPDPDSTAYLALGDETEREEISFAPRAAPGGQSQRTSDPNLRRSASTSPTFARADPDLIRRAWTTGSLTVTSDPAGARISIDGQPRGSAPLTLGDLKPGTYRISASLPGHETQNYNVVVNAGAVLLVEAELASSR